MKAESILRKIAAGASTAVLAVTLTACSHTSTATVAGADDYGHVATSPENATSNTNTTPNVIAGPAKVDSSGNVYTSSSAGGAGNGSAIGTNTNINTVPTPVTGSSTVTYTADTTVTTPPATVEVVTPTLHQIFVAKVGAEAAVAVRNDDEEQNVA